MTHTTQTAQPSSQPVPGLGAPLSTGALLRALRDQPQQPLEFHLDGALLVPAGYHVTEVRAVSTEAMDCGGQAAAWRETVIQLMDGSPEEARAGFMTNRKFLAIYDRVARRIPVRGEAEVRFEYGNARLPAIQYHVDRLGAEPGRLVLHLRTPGVQCKAGALCGLPATAEAATGDACAPESGCCAPQAPISLG